MILCSFSDFQLPLNEYPKNLKGKPLHDWICKYLKARTKFSCFEIQEDYRMCRTLMFLQKIGKIKLCNEGLGYPYTNIILKRG